MAVLSSTCPVWLLPEASAAAGGSVLGAWGNLFAGAVSS